MWNWGPCSGAISRNPSKKTMHISEGVLSLPVLVAGAGVALAGVAYGIKKLPEDKLMFAGLLGAAFFAASLIHVPIGVTSVHLVLNGLLGTLLGAAAFPVIFVSLLLQGFLLGFGGLTTLGLNTATIGLGALASALLFQFLRPRNLRPSPMIDTLSFLCGALGIIVSALLTALALATTDAGFTTSAMALLLAHVPIACIEGVLTLFAYRSILKLAPQLLEDSP